MTNPRPSSPHTRGDAHTFVLTTLLLITVTVIGTVPLIKPLTLSEVCRSPATLTFGRFDDIHHALINFQHDLGRYPTATEGLPALLTAPPNTRHWNGPYLPSIPVDTWNSPFLYTTPTPDSFLVTSLGPDRTLNTADDLTLPSP